MFYTDTMKQTVALAEMLASKDGTLQRDRKEFDLRSRERMEGELDRVRTRERLDATIAGIGELEYLRQRQELLVRSVLNYTDSATATNEDKVCHMPEENYLNSEEKLLEENILLLRKQLVGDVFMKSLWVFVRGCWESVAWHCQSSRKVRSSRHRSRLVRQSFCQEIHYNGCHL